MRLPRYNVDAVTPESVEVPVTVSVLAVDVANVSVPENVLSPAKVCVVVLTMPSVVPFAYEICAVVATPLTVLVSVLPSHESALVMVTELLVVERFPEASVVRMPPVSAAKRTLFEAMRCAIVVVARVVVLVNVFSPEKDCVVVETIPSAVVEAYGRSDNIDDVLTRPLLAVRIPVKLPRYRRAADTHARVDVPVTVKSLSVVVASVVVAVNVFAPAKVCVVVLTMPSVVPFA